MDAYLKKKQEKNKKEKDNQYKIKSSMAIAIELMKAAYYMESAYSMVPSCIMFHRSCQLDTTSHVLNEAHTISIVCKHHARGLRHIKAALHMCGFSCEYAILLNTAHNSGSYHSFGWRRSFQIKG